MCVTCAWVVLSVLSPWGMFEARSETPRPCPVFDWETMPDNTWSKLETCGVPFKKVFHGAATIASDRSTVFFFGADTHESHYDNSVMRLHLDTLEWTRDYAPDPLEGYTISGKGVPITGKGRPWAMHAFDTWDYHPPTGRLIFVGFPKHGHRAKVVVKQKGLDPNIMKPTTWLYDPDQKTWNVVDAPSPNLFASGLVWDSHRDEFVGHDGSLTYHFTMREKLWRTLPASSLPGWSQKLIFDTNVKEVRLLGSNTSSSDLWAYSSDIHQWKLIPVDKAPLPANGAALAYNPDRSVLLYIANDHSNAYSNPTGKSRTYVLVSKSGAWERLPVVSPPLYGMNYLTQYDPKRGVFLHFEKSSPTDQRMAVWALRLTDSLLP